MVRYRSLVDAVEGLLQHHAPEDIGHYQIAEAAQVSAASVYHFFPTREAAFMALAERYLDAIHEQLSRPIEAARLGGWQDLIAIDHRRTTDLYNAHPTMLKVFYGASILRGWQADDRFTAGVAARWGERCRSAFDTPMVPDFETKCLIRIAIVDAIYTISYQRHGHITDAFHDQGVASGIAHMALYLPARLERQPRLAAAAAKGDHVVLPLPLD